MMDVWMLVIAILSLLLVGGGMISAGVWGVAKVSSSVDRLSVKVDSLGDRVDSLGHAVDRLDMKLDDHGQRIARLEERGAV